MRHTSLEPELKILHDHIRGTMFDQPGRKLKAKNDFAAQNVFCFIIILNYVSNTMDHNHHF